MTNKQQLILGVIVSVTTLAVSVFGLTPESSEQLTTAFVGIASGIFAIYRVLKGK